MGSTVHVLVLVYIYKVLVHIYQEFLSGGTKGAFTALGHCLPPLGNPEYYELN